VIAAPSHSERLSSRLPRRWPVSADLAAVAAFLVVALILVAPALRPGYTLVPFDILSTVAPWQEVVPGPPQNTILSDPVFVAYPFRQHLTEALNQGHLALWNPNILAGHPSLGDPEAETFYPLTWLLVRLLPLPRTFAIDAWLHLALAGILMYAFLRAMGLSPLAASVGGLIWMLNSNRVAWLTFPALTHTGAWTPGVFWGFERAVRRQTGGVALGAACLGMMLLASWIQFTLYTLLLLAPYVAWRAWESGRRSPRGSGWQTMGAGAAIILLGTGLGSAALLPMIEFARLSHRDAFDAATLVATRLPWRALLTFAAPNFFGTHQPGQNYWGPGNYNECVAYFSAPGLLLAAMAPWLDRRARGFWLWAGMLLLAVLLGTPLVRVLAPLPVLNRFSLSRLLFLVPFIGGVLAALGLEGLRAGGKALRAAGTVALISAAVTLAGLSLAGFMGVRQLRSQAPASWEHLALAFFWWLVAGLVCYAGARPSAARLPFTASVPLLVAANLLSIQIGRNPTVAASWAYPQRPVLSELSTAAAGGRVMPLHAARRIALGPNIAPIFGLREADGYASLILKSYREFVAVMDDNIRYQPMRENLNMVAFSDYHPRIMDFLNVRALAAAEPLPPARAAGLVPIARGDGLYIYRNPHALPRAFLVHDAEVIPAQRARLARLADPALDLSRTVVLSDAPKSGVSPLLALASGQAVAQAAWRRPLGAPDTATIQTDRDTSVAVVVHVAGPGFLTMSDSFYPGWRATVGGHPAAVLRANHAFRAVAVPAGDSEVSFRFEPASVRLGLFLSLLAATVILAGLAALAALARRSAGATSSS
jgi:hypothetical protein